MQQKHSPLPWIIGKQGGAVVFVKATGEAVSDCRTFMGERDPREPQEQANAEFIVRACNAHEELLDACGKVKLSLQLISASPDVADTLLHTVLGINIQVLEAAIAKAEAKGEKP